jgi:5-bromo-4-chloroindolyl phosphate hydrolysis protein
MINIGMFPEGRFDEQETCIMLNQESYKQYQELQKSIRMQEMSNVKKDNMEGQAGISAANDYEVRKAIEAGRSCIQQIREANDAIPGEEISKRLDRLEEVIGKIFLYIEQHPSQLTDIQKFMDYYLPTTLKLVNAYKEFDRLSVEGDNISTAKNEIEETLNTINHAFENLLDSLYEDVTMDVSSDISVLETLLAQEGLTRKDFVSNE